MSLRYRPIYAWLLLLIGFGCMLPGLAHRLEVETGSNRYEISMAYRDVAALRFGGVGVEEAFDELADAGLTSTAVDMISIRDLEVQGALTLLDRGDVLALLLNAGASPSEVPPTTGAETFLIIAETEDEAATIARIQFAGGQEGVVTPIDVGDLTIYQVSGIESLGAMPLGYDDAQLRNLANRGLAAIARVPSSVRSVDFAVQELIRIRDAYGVDRFQLVGDTTPFPADPDMAFELATRLNDAGFTIAIPERVVQVGIDLFGGTMDDIVRIRNVGLARRENDTTIEDTLRTVAERNVRILVLRAHAALTARERLELTAEQIGEIRSRIPDRLELGVAQPFAELQPTPLLFAGAALTSAAMALMAYPLVGTVPAIAGAVLVALMIAGMAVTGSTTAGNLTRLAVAVLAATVSAFVARPRADLAPMIFQYLRSAIVLFVGALTVTALAFDSAFLVGARDFWGVKVLLLAPPVIAAAIAVYMSLGRPRPAALVPVLQMPIRLWHAILAGVVIGSVWFMLLRSGNTGIQIDVELVLREQLEQIFAIRPRTKEFLIGFPALVLAIVAAARSRHGWWLYAVAAIGTASAVNTFTHFHSPLLVSTLRTIYGMGIGLVMGLVFLGIAWGVLRIVRRLRSSHPDR